MKSLSIAQTEAFLVESLQGESTHKGQSHEKKGILQHGICDECSTKVETTGHVLWNCQKAKDNWAYSKVVAPRGGEECVSFHDFLWQLVMVDRVEEDKLAQIVTIAWAL